MTKAEYNRAYYQQNRERILAKNKAYREAHREEILAKNKAYRAVHPLYVVWDSMMRRCAFFKGASAEQLARYAGRGITVCQEWRSSFKPFEEWALANGYKPGLQLDRIDNNGNYCPENCRFVTPRENNLNKRNTVMFGDKPVAHWFDTMGHAEGLRYETFLTRLSHGWPICRALFEPVHK